MGFSLRPVWFGRPSPDLPLTYTSLKCRFGGRRMFIFVGDLPKGATEHDLWRLGRVRDSSARARIFKKAYRDGHVARYGLLQVTPDSEARRVMGRLRLARLDSGPLRVHPFVSRHGSANERRAIGWRARPWDAPERRQEERRSFSVRPSF